MPILKVRLNKLSNDWHVARAILEDEYASLDKTSNKFRTRYEFAAHLLEVHRLWCVRRALPRPACVPLRSDGGTADGAPGRLSRAGATNAEAAQSKIYLSTSTQTGVKQEDQDDERSQENDKDREKRKEDKRDDGKVSSRQDEVSDQHSTGVKSIVKGTNSSSDLLIKLEVVSHENHDVDMESSQDHSTSHQGYKEEIPTQHMGPDVQLHLDRTHPSSDVHVKKEENRDVDIERSVTVSTPEQRHEEESLTKHIGSESCFENTNSSSGLLVKKELLSQEPCDGERESSRNKSTSHHGHEEGIPTQHNGSDKQSILERSNPDSDLHRKQDVVPHENHNAERESSRIESMTNQGDEEEISTENIGSDGEAALENIGSPSRSTSDIDRCSPKSSSSDLCHAGISSNNNPRSRRRKSLQCKVWSNSKNSLHLKTQPEPKLHNQRRNSRKNPYQCLVCERYYASNRTLAVHMKTHTGEKPFECNICSYRCSQNSVLKIHMRTHSGEKPYQCNTCGYSCSYKSNLTSHMRQHSGEKPYRCSVCNKAFALNGDLTRHMRTHTGEKPYDCNLCSYRCLRKSDLTRHMITHTGEKPFQCNTCGYRCSYKGNLKSHMRTHTGEKPFECNSCSFRCSNKTNLTSHMRQHSGEKPYQCSVCNKAFAHSVNRLVHMRTHTGEKPFECNICNYRCSRKNNLTLHMKNH